MPTYEFIWYMEIKWESMEEQFPKRQVDRNILPGVFCVYG